MKHPFITDRKYRWGALFLIVFIAAAYLTGYEYDNYIFANIAAAVFGIVGVTAYFILRK